MSEEELNGFTPTERRILLLLADGKPHSRYQLLECIKDEMATLKNLQSHISKLRRKLSEGEWILCELHNRSICYRHFALLPAYRKSQAIV